MRLCRCAAPRASRNHLHIATDSELGDCGLDVHVERLTRADVAMLIPIQEVARA